jgi:ATP-dependent protease ClpP protease subunit
MYSMDRVVLAAIIAILAVTAKAQQPPVPPPQNPPQIAVITFMGDVNTASVGVLLQVVNGQIRSGVHKITLVISSGGGDSSAAFAAYNYLRNLPVEVTTFNIGNIDSAAVILYCAGRHRYSLPATRFLIHGNSLVFGANSMMDAAALQGNLEVLKSLNQMLVHVVVSATNKSQTEIEAAVRSQVILTPEDAKRWNLIEEIKPDFMEPGAVLVSVNAPAPPTVAPPMQFTSISPASAK